MELSHLGSETSIYVFFVPGVVLVGINPLFVAEINVFLTFQISCPYPISSLNAAP